MLNQLIVTLLLLVVSVSSWATPVQWQRLSPGMKFTVINTVQVFPPGHVYAFRFDLKHYRLKLALAKDHAKLFTSVKALLKQYGAVLGVNGGFFTPTFQPLGLRISDGVLKNPLKPISWWGVFVIKNSKARIVSQKNYRYSKAIRFAIQSGPRLVVNGRIPPLKPGVDDRTAIGITRKGKIVIAVTQDIDLTTTQLAKLMRKPNASGGLACSNALNLDGGSSVQLSAKIHHFVLNLPGYSVITDAVLVITKS